MKKIVLLCLLLLLTFGNTATAANWQYVMSPSKGKLVFFDAETITINKDGYLDVWSKWVLDPPINSNIAYYLSHEQYNNIPRNIRYVGVYAYDTNNHLIDESTTTSRWFDIIPDSSDEAFYNKVLSYYANRMRREAQNL